MITSRAGRDARRLALTLLLVSSATVGCSGGSTAGSSSAPTPPGATPAPIGGDGNTGGNDTLVQLVWAPNSDAVAGYIVYYGASADSTTTVASDIAINSAGFNPQMPTVTYYAAHDLNLETGANVCFRLRAYNSSNTLSGWSEAACGTT